MADRGFRMGKLESGKAAKRRIRNWEWERWRMWKECRISDVGWRMGKAKSRIVAR